MYTTMNLSVYDMDMNRYRNAADLRAFYRDRGMEGVELQLIAGQPLPGKITREDIIGVHLNMYPYWYDLYSGDVDTLMREFLEWENADMYYGGSALGIPLTDAAIAQKKGREIILTSLKMELNAAEALGAKYVVFHGAENRLTELWTGIAENRDKEVIDAVIEIANALLDGEDYHFEFLVENLWTAGFTFTDPEMTRRLIKGIHYPKKGIMLDTGHLLHTNLDLVTEQDAVDYIHTCLDAHGALCEYIRGIHLQQSITGEYVRAHRGPAPAVNGDFWDWHNMAMYFVFDVDTHHAWTTPQIRSVVRRVHPEYLNMELMAESREAFGRALEIQRKALGIF